MILRSFSALLDGGADAAARDENGRRRRGLRKGQRRDDLAVLAYPQLLVTRPTALVTQGVPTTGNLQPSDGVGQYYGYYDEWTYSAVAGQRRRDHHGLEDVDAYLVSCRTTEPKSRATTTEEPTITLAWNSGHARLNSIQYLQRASPPKRRGGM